MQLGGERAFYLESGAPEGAQGIFRNPEETLAKSLLFLTPISCASRLSLEDNTSAVSDGSRHSAFSRMSRQAIAASQPRPCLSTSACYATQEAFKTRAAQGTAKRGGLRESNTDPKCFAASMRLNLRESACQPFPFAMGCSIGAQAKLS